MFDVFRSVKISPPVTQSWFTAMEEMVESGEPPAKRAREHDPAEELQAGGSAAGGNANAASIPPEEGLASNPSKLAVEGNLDLNESDEEARLERPASESSPVVPPNPTPVQQTERDELDSKKPADPRYAPLVLLMFSPETTPVNEFQ